MFINIVGTDTAGVLAFLHRGKPINIYVYIYTAGTPSSIYCIEE